MQEAETVGIDLAAKMVNDEEAEKILNIAKSQTDAAIEAEKQRKALLVSWNFTELCWILQPVRTNVPLSIDNYSKPSFVCGFLIFAIPMIQELH